MTQHPGLHLLRLACFLASLVSASAVQFDIPAQPVPPALRLFMKQANAQVVFNESALQAVTSTAVQGDLSAPDALAQLLTATGYAAEQTGSRSFTVAKIGTAKPGSIEGSVRDESGKPVAGAKVALADSDKAVATDKRGRFLLTGVVAGAHVLQITADGLQNTRVTDITVKPGLQHSLSPITIPVQKEGTFKLEDFVVSAKKNDGVVELDPYSVEAEREKPFTKNSLDLARSREDPLPFQTFTQQEITLSGAFNLDAFLRNNLPQNFASVITSEVDGTSQNQSSRLSQVDFRGWGSTETVILLNGRRLAPEFQAFQPDTTNSTPNLKAIPLSSIERVEILSSAGSAIYGANATGGVINIVTKANFSGGEIAASFQSPDDANAPSRSVDFNYAYTLPKNVTVRVAASYSDKTPLRVGDRADVSVARWRNYVMAREPTRLLPARPEGPNFVSGSTVGATPNILSGVIGANLFASSPTTTPSNFTSVPAGGSGNTPLSSYVPARYNLELAEGNGGDSLTGLASTLGAWDKNWVYSVGFDKHFGEGWRFSVDLDRKEQRTKGNQGAGVVSLSFAPTTLNGGGAQRVPAAAPTNPFGIEVRVSLLDPYMKDITNTVDNDTWDVTATLRGKIGRWYGFIDAAQSVNTNHYNSGQFWEPVGGWRAALLSGAYNPFVDPRVRAPGVAPSFYDTYVLKRSYTNSETKTSAVNAKISGPVWDLKAGPVSLTAGTEWRRTFRDRSDSFVQYEDYLSGQPVIAFGTTSSIASPLSLNPTGRFEDNEYSLYAETNIPLVAKQGLPLFSKLDAFGSGRISKDIRDGLRFDLIPVHYTTTPTVYAGGVRYEIKKGISLRYSKSVGFRPPGINLITPSVPPTSTTTVTDSRRGNSTVVLSPSQYSTGGNFDLVPETTHSTNAGLIVEFFKENRLRASVDYLDSKRDNAIFSLSPQQVLDNESALSSRVTRGPADGHASGVGPITFVDARNINLALVESKSIDINVEQYISNVFGGRIVATIAGTKNVSFKVQTTATTPAVEQVRNPTATFSQALKWNAVAGIRWEGRQWTASWATRYFDEILARPTDYRLQGSDRADWALNHDVSLSYFGNSRRERTGFAAAMLSGTTISAGVQNLFDRKPRFWAADSGRGVAPYDSLAGRTLWIQVRKAL